MNNENNSKKLYTLISLEEFKAVLGPDERDEKLVRFCLTTATHTVEQFCHRRLLTKGHFEDLDFWGDRTIPLNHYPVQKVFAVYMRIPGEKEMALLEPDYYSVEPEPGTAFDTPACLVLSPALRVMRCEKSLRVVYKTGYVAGKAAGTPNAVPADLAAACLELASWNLTRYKGRRIGMTGNVRGSGKDGEHLEMGMPENVKSLLRPYRRGMI